MDNMQDIKTKYNTLQESVTKLNNEKIGLESEIKTIESDMSDLAKKLLELTKKTSVEEALKYYKELSSSLESKKNVLSKELDSYMNKDIKLD